MFHLLTKKAKILLIKLKKMSKLLEIYLKKGK